MMAFVSLERLLLFGLLLLRCSAFGLTCQGEEGYYSDAVRSGGSDVIVVRQDNGTLQSTPFHLQIGRFSSFLSFWFRRSGQSVDIFINEQKGPSSLHVSESGATCFEPEGEDRVGDVWSSEEWSIMNLRLGINNAYYEISSLGIKIPFKVYLYEQNAKLVITDVDGTITESDVKGHIFSSFGTSAHHFNVVPFFEAVSKRGYQIVYLTARSISQDDATRHYLFTTLKNLGLPRGPLMMSPKPLAETLLDSTVGSPREAKASNLRDLLGLFEEGPEVVKGAYGNVESDSQAYQDVGIPKSRIYIINENGHLRREDGEVEISSYENELNNIEEIYPKITS